MFIPIVFILFLLLMPVLARLVDFAFAPAGGLAALGVIVWLSTGLWPAIVTVGVILTLCAVFPRLVYVGDAVWGLILGLPTFLVVHELGAPMWLAAPLGLAVALVPLQGLFEPA